MRDALETGLRHRLRRALRRIEEQHVELRERMRELETDARAAGDCCLPCAELNRFGDALRAHFELEDDVLFPALNGLNPCSCGDLEALSREHALLLAALRDLAAEPAPPGDGFDRLRGSLRDHERREEHLVGSILGADGGQELAGASSLSGRNPSDRRFPG
jgi:hypothetical protein